MGLHSSLYSKLEQLLVVAAVLLTIAYIIDKTRRFFIRRQFARRYGCQPVPRACNREPFLGLDIAGTIIRAHRQHKLLETINELFRLHKNTFTSKEFLRHVILTVEPENIKTILSTRFNDYGLDYRLEYFSPLLGKGIFDTDGDHWAASRALIRPNFTRDQVADLRAFERLISDLFSLVPRDGVTVVDLQDLFFRYTIDSATEFLFGQSVGSLKMAGSDLGFAYAFNYSQDNIRRQALFGPFRIFYRDPKADECNRICREFGQRFVDEAVLAVQREGEKKTDLTPEAKDQKYIFLQELSRRTSDKRRILDESMNVLLAGRDTTASLLSNMFFMLAKNPAMWAKLRKEVASLEGRPPTYEEIRNLKYLKCCMNECKATHSPIYIPVTTNSSPSSPPTSSRTNK